MAAAAGEADSLAMFVETKPGVAERALELASVGASDVLYDVGCGDGRVLVSAAQATGARCVGIEADPRYVAKSRETVAAAGAQALVRIDAADAQTADLAEATVVYVFMTRFGLLRLRPKLARLRPGTRVVCCMSKMGGGWEPDAVSEDPGLGQVGDLFLYTVRADLPEAVFDSSTELRREFKDYAPPRINLGGSVRRDSGVGLGRGRGRDGPRRSCAVQ